MTLGGNAQRGSTICRFEKRSYARISLKSTHKESCMFVREAVLALGSILRSVIIKLPKHGVYM